jgi:hypothetical protein
MKLVERNTFFSFQIGAKFLPFFNAFATSLTTFSYSDPTFQDGTNVYPGA